jgi:glycosyltransferase involved in cell wall biosynthesis
MHAEVRESFVFLVVTYNHQEYILEHLESIKYLVVTHAEGIDVDIIVNDDFSKDNTRTLVDRWLQVNSKLFRKIKTIYNEKNLGTCASVSNMLTHVMANRCKITAGDDVYSFENIFELTKHQPDVAMVSGRALYLLGNELGIDRRSNILSTATQVIYENDTLLHRFKHFSYNNAPNLQYATECLLNPEVRSYLNRFDVTEDWPLQVAIARKFPNRRFKLIDEVLVYYRRTTGSTYIVANKRFIEDKNLIYKDLIANETSWTEKLRLKTRQLCFKKNNWWLNKIINLDLYFFIGSFVWRMRRIITKNNAVGLGVAQHKLHYAQIKLTATTVGEHLKINNLNSL